MCGQSWWYEPPLCIDQNVFGILITGRSQIWCRLQSGKHFRRHIGCCKRMRIYNTPKTQFLHGLLMLWVLCCQGWWYEPLLFSGLGHKRCSLQNSKHLQRRIGCCKCMRMDKTRRKSLEGTFFWSVWCDVFYVSMFLFFFVYSHFRNWQFFYTHVFCTHRHNTPMLNAQHS